MLSIWRTTSDGSSIATPCTPRVFCAVTAVRAEVPKQPSMAKVLRSAWIPAPPPVSLPAMVSVIGRVGMRRSIGGQNELHVDFDLLRRRVGAYAFGTQPVRYAGPTGLPHRLAINDLGRSDHMV